MDLTNVQTLRQLMNQHGIRPQHRLGQNFLIDGEVLDRIVEGASLGPTDVVLEIGPGLGALTQRLAAAAGRVVAVELDRGLVAILQERLLPVYPNLEILHGDAVRIDLRALLTERLAPGEQAKVVANLPYYVTTPLIMRMLEEELPLDQIVVMVQKEVADRMISPPGSKEYGALSVAVQYYTVPDVVTAVGRNAFMPSPDVDSAVVSLRIRTAPPVTADRTQFFKVVKAAFGQRRKSLPNALANGLGLDKGLVQEALTLAGIELNRRGETLSLEEFANVTRKIFSATSGG